MNLFFRRHAVFYPSRWFFASNSIYKKATSFISYKILWMCVFQISCFFVSFEGSLKGLKLGVQHISCYMLYGISHLCLLFFFIIICVSVLQNFKYKWWNLYESIFIHSDWYKFLWTFCSKFYWYIIYLPQIYLSEIIYWSLKEYSFLQWKPPMHYINQYLEKLKVFSVCSHVESFLCIRKIPPKKCGAELVTVTN